MASDQGQLRPDEVEAVQRQLDKALAGQAMHDMPYAAMMQDAAMMLQDAGIANPDRLLVRPSERVVTAATAARINQVAQDARYATMAQQGAYNTAQQIGAQIAATQQNIAASIYAQQMGVSNNASGLAQNSAYGQAQGNNHNPLSGGFHKVPRPITRDDLDSDVFKAPLAVLVDLWRVRFGDGWVNSDMVQQRDIKNDRDANFWFLLHARLKGTGRLEQINIGGFTTGNAVYRLIQE